MDTKVQIAGPSLPMWCLLPANALFLVLIAYVLMRTRGNAGRFVIFACWLRFTLEVFHEQSYALSPLGMSWIALSSVAVVVLGFVVLDYRRFFSWPFISVGLICLLMAISAVANGEPKGALEPIVRYVYFMMICIGFWQAVERSGQEFLKRFLWVFASPIVFQIFSVVLNIPKAGENDGSASYIGGYYHEQHMSLVLATCFLVTCFITQIPRALKATLIAYALIGIWIANYRTVILGIAPLAMWQFSRELPGAFVKGQRGLVLTGMGVVGAALIGVAAMTGSGERFGDIATMFRWDLIKDPATFDREDRQVLNGRTYIWSNYIYAYAEGKPFQKIIGAGPDSWTDRFEAYAHNTLVSYLYELGILGVGAILLLWGTMFSLALKAEREWRARIVAGHISFFILNMATMPHWQIEGNILYGVLCGYTLAKARAARQVRGARRSPAYGLPPERLTPSYVPQRPVPGLSPASTARRHG
jgi:hypothetical protein